MMISIRKASIDDYLPVRDFYYCVTDEMKDAEFKPGWERDIYPAQEFLQTSLHKGELYIGEIKETIAAAMVINHEYNESYAGAPWSVDAADEELFVIHALGVRPVFSGQGIAQDMVQYAIHLGQEQRIKTIRLDVLPGNIPAERVYKKMGFTYCHTVRMFYEDTGWTEYDLFEFVYA